MNQHWHRWIHASLRTYVEAELQALDTYVFYEGQSREDLRDKLDYVEFRWNGPEAREPSRGYWFLDVNLNFVISSTSNRENTYMHQVVVGRVQSILGHTIEVFRLGDDINGVDDQTLFGCLLLKTDTREPIMTNYFGRMQEVELEQSTVEANYCMSGRFV